MTRKVALITGGTGQDGWYLSRYLLAQNYQVHCQSRTCPTLSGHQHDVSWHVGDLVDRFFLERLLATINPTEIYNLAAIARPVLSWQYPIETAEINAIVPHRLCELIRHQFPQTRLFQASSSEIFGPSVELVQDENTPRHPQSPYGISKSYAHSLMAAYRHQFGVYSCSGILFNHESPRRELSYVSQKIAHAAAAIALGINETREMDERGRPIVENGMVTLGAIDVRRDFGFAGDYAEAMHSIMSHHQPDDYVIGTGQTHSIGEFCKEAFSYVGKRWEDHVTHDASLVRKSDIDTRANPEKLKKLTGFVFRTQFSELVAMMVDARLAALEGAQKR